MALQSGQRDGGRRYASTAPLEGESHRPLEHEQERQRIPQRKDIGRLYLNGHFSSWVKKGFNFFFFFFFFFFCCFFFFLSSAYLWIDGAGGGPSAFPLPCPARGADLMSVFPNC